MRGMDKMFQSITGISSDEMKSYVASATELLRSLDENLKSIRLNCEETNVRIRRLEKHVGISDAPMSIEFLENENHAQEN